MLKTLKSDIQKYYYDPKFRGVDVDALFKEADGMLAKAESPGQMFGIIALTLLSFNDSHTFFLPPSWAGRIDYGWQMQYIGDACYVVSVKPGSDAAAKGLRPGDIVHVVENVKPTRDTLWKINYLYNTLRPQPALRVIVQSPGGEPRTLELASKITQGKRVRDLTDMNEYMDMLADEERAARYSRHRYIEMGDDALIWKMPQFDLPEKKVDEMMGKAKGKKALILDLRGNPGGYEVTLLRVMGNIFDKDVKLGDVVGREEKKQKPVVAKTRGDNIYKGQVVVLIDSESGSSAELLARVVQLEKRGTVIGDKSAGAVMRARQMPHTAGMDTVVFYGLSVTVDDLKMTDGMSLEGTGVTPDELILPTSTDLSTNRDAVLSRAAAIVGLKIDPEKAGTLFPLEWAP
jgi:C-terminal processing protease CtpA/Prc